MERILGVDIGGVIISHNEINGAYLPIPDVFEKLKELQDKKFGKNIFVVSCADTYLRFAMLNWLSVKKFHKETGISLDRVHFCEERKEKARICQHLGVTDFVDDRKEIMVYLYNAGVKNLYLFQGRAEEEGCYEYILPHVKKIDSWLTLGKDLLG